jgi:hypothetical protein
MNREIEIEMESWAIFEITIDNDQKVTSNEAVLAPTNTSRASKHSKT